ncbi:uncharacterized protein LOC112519726 [Cynara cardunculus var. scolymus]|uniref:Uncharacterized protein n=1 Tax=Cynara cardunculus var. scolymus TaxID=59895 RepID=A0A124SEE2_CYNCS|nr:uncharacterized protein LOC112519726 [Cynara cardunculus var. scolymus]KVH99835.1 hypothetical protein Ccrd_021922 [Cynara cardunculus var. scolymus]
MVITTNCCFNHRLPTAPPAATQPPPSARPKRVISWRNQCVVGMACVIIGLQTEGIVGNNDDYAIAADAKAVVESKVKGKKRWSDKRMCPAWQLNSLETIVPEDLPRPSHKRRWEGVGDHLRVAPPVKASTATVVGANNGCFSM